MKKFSSFFLGILDGLFENGNFFLMLFCSYKAYRVNADNPGITWMLTAIFTISCWVVIQIRTERRRLNDDLTMVIQSRVEAETQRVSREMSLVIRKFASAAWNEEARERIANIKW
jgi:hypothetical protein